MPPVALKPNKTNGYIYWPQRLWGKKISPIYTRRASDFQGYSWQGLFILADESADADASVVRG
jgi:hypothetical protein